MRNRGNVRAWLQRHWARDRWVTMVAGCASVLVVVGVLLHYPRPGDSVREPQVVVTSGMLKKNSFLYDELRAEGLAPVLADEVTRAMRPIFDPRRVRPGDRYEIWRSSAGMFVEFRYWMSPVKYMVVTGAEGAMKATGYKVELQDQVVGGRVEITSSLWESMAGLGLDSELIYRLSDIFAWQIDFLTEPRKGDVLKLVWRRHSNATVVEEGDILIAQYIGKETGDKTAIYFNGDYYDEKGRSLKREFLRAPLNFRRISSSFARKRFNPVLRVWRPHHGTDYAAAHGTAVVAVGAGRVTYVGRKGGYGNYVGVAHNSAYMSAYAHLSRYAKGIKPGTRVEQGQVVGYVGSTGISTGPHLHFEFNKYGRPVNFLAERFDSGKNLAKKDMEAFEPGRRGALIYLAQLLPNSRTVVKLKDPASLSTSNAGR
ncbi:MAG: peptidoglycan DD-metalloendopeptidase family protein [Elusimicrobiota bacterium]